MLRPSDFIKAVLLEAAWFEASHLGGVKPMQMVAQCIGNRVRLGWGDWHQVLSNLATYSQLTATNRLKLQAESSLPSAGDPRFAALIPLIDQAYENTGAKLVEGGVIWADLQWPIESEWFERNVLRGTDYKRVSQSATLVIWG